jgi:hypothetical protein
MKPLEEMEASILSGAPYDYGHDMLDLINEVRRLNFALEGALNEMERSSEEAESLRLLLKRGATLSYRGQGWRVVGLTLYGSTATYESEDAALDAAVKAILEEKS